MNVAGGVTVSFGDEHLKCSPPGGPDLDAERIRLAWAGAFTPVPAVVDHGDACAPNTLIDDNGAWAGLVDLGSLGIADRWADIAVALLSLGWNYGPGCEAAFLDAYGVDPDRTRIAYYQHLWNATP